MAGQAPARERTHLTPGEWKIMEYVARQDEGARTSLVTSITGLSTADAMLRRLRELGLVMSRHVKGSGHVLTWSLTNRGVDAGLEHERVARAIEQLKHSLNGRLTKSGGDYAMRYARWRSGLHRVPAEPVPTGLRPVAVGLVKRIVDDALDGATTGR